MKRFLFFLLILAGVGTLWWSPLEKPYVPPAPSFELPVVVEAKPWTPEIATLLHETNRNRVANGLGELVLKQSLDESATRKCLDMQTRNYWGHHLEGEETWKDFTDTGILGENLAKSYPSAEAVVQGWMSSEGHRNNILNPVYTRVGFASCEGPQHHLIVQHFSSF